MSIYDWHHTSWDLRSATGLTALLPVGAIEPYGPHLPLDTQNRLLDAIARRVAERLPGDVYLLPTLPFGQSGAYAGFPGAVGLSWRTLLATLTDLGYSLLQTGVRRLAVLAGLGGAGCTTALPRENRIVKTAVRRLNYEHPDLDALWVQPLTVATPPLEELFPSARDDFHGGEVVTSLMLHLWPELVRLERIRDNNLDHVPSQKAAILDAVPFSTLCPQGVWGRPSQSDVERGAAALEAIVAGTARYIEETFQEMARLKRHPG
ncbi:MAG: creatininase family protein [Chloroflexi bacterium]|nr:creatininase family protein [Chloroflexota bacterium]